MMPQRLSKNLLITGGAGFIGSHVVRHFVKQYPDYCIYNLDALTYAGNLENLTDIEPFDNYTFLKADITERNSVFQLFNEYAFDAVIHLAAESHVDRSITDATDFIETNVQGTVNLLDACKDAWNEDYNGKRFYHISTDEVYGSINEGKFNEISPYSPNSPYAASKAASDHFVRAYHTTYKLPVVISNCSNNFGPFQFPEKFIPLCINNLINQKPLPVYGKGDNIRDWLYVEDHVEAIDCIFHEGKNGETYCVGGNNELSNLQVVKQLCSIMDGMSGRPSGTSEQYIRFVSDRPGHDFRYAIDHSKLTDELGWEPKISFTSGLEETIQWYLDNIEWLEHVTSGSYKQYYDKMYEERHVTKKDLR